MILPLIWACSGEPAPSTTTPDAEATQKIRLALNWYPEPEFGGFYEAVRAGYYEQAGLEVEIIPGGPGAPSLELLSSGRVEAAITAADDLLLKRNRGITAVGVFAAFQDAPMGIMVHSASGAQTFEDIQDGQIAIEIGSSFQSFLWERYAWNDTVRPIPYGGGVGQFMNDPTFRQQAYITSEPCLARSQGAEVTFLRAADAGWNPYSVVLAVPDPEQAWVQDFVDASRKGWEAYMADPNPANAVIATLNDQFTPPLLQCVTDAQRAYVEGAQPLGGMVKERWDETAATMIRLGLLPEGASAEGAWTSL